MVSSTGCGGAGTFRQPFLAFITARVRSRSHCFSQGPPLYIISGKIKNYEIVMAFRHNPLVSQKHLDNLNGCLTLIWTNRSGGLTVLLKGCAAYGGLSYCQAEGRFLSPLFP